MDYYKVLELEEGATPQEIKKAYFSMVRRYSPEEDPDKFREIREAYEYLQKADSKEGPVFPKPQDPLAVNLLSHIENIEKQRDYNLMRDACEEALHHFPKDLHFLYLLAMAQRKAGNTGKAVKNCELLVKKEPENKWFLRELAISYMERGFTRKAVSAFERAYKAGCRDSDFMLTYAMECEEYGQYKTGMDVLFELVRQKKGWNREQMPELFEAYIGLISIEMIGEENRFLEILESLRESVETYSIYAEENIDNLYTILAAPIHFRKFKAEETEVIKKIFSVLERSCHLAESREILGDMKKACMTAFIESDDRLGDTVKRGADAVMMVEGSMFHKYAMLDTQLCMIAEREEILPQLEILRQEYPAYYEKIRDFAERLTAGRNLEYLKSTLMEKYVRLSGQVGGGFYFEKYPQEEARIYGSEANRVFMDEPYVRSEKKIGRNSPCPCGSGKKYKHCCGR